MEHGAWSMSLAILRAGALERLVRIGSVFIR